MEGGGGGGRGLRERCLTTSDDSISQKEGTGTFITFRGRICEMSRLCEQEEKEEVVVVVVVEEEEEEEQQQQRQQQLEVVAARPSHLHQSCENTKPNPVSQLNLHFPPLVGCSCCHTPTHTVLGVFCWNK